MKKFVLIMLVVFFAILTLGADWNLNTKTNIDAPAVDDEFVLWDTSDSADRIKNIKPPDLLSGVSFDAKEMSVGTISGSTAEVSDLTVKNGISGVTAVFTITGADSGVTITKGSPGDGASPHANGDNFVIEENGAAGMTFRTPSNQSGAIYWNDMEANNAGLQVYSHFTDEFTWQTEATNRIRVGASGVTLLQSGDTLYFGSGGAGIWESGSGEIWVSDDAGNATQLSSHDPVTGEFILNSHNVHTGISTKIRLERVIELLEQQTGETLIARSKALPKAKIAANIQNRRVKLRRLWMKRWIEENQATKPTKQEALAALQSSGWEPPPLPKYILDKAK